MRASSSTRVTGAMHRAKSALQSSSNRARVSRALSEAPSQKASISTCPTVFEERESFSCSQAVRNRRSARAPAAEEGSSGGRPGFFRTKSPSRWFIIFWSKSCPPRCVSPAVALTSK